MSNCRVCSSYAINPHCHGRKDGVDLDLCDVCYWRKRSIQEYVRRQRRWSKETFGPGPLDDGIIDHISKELEEIKQSPGDISEWTDVAILALDGAWRNGYTPEEVAQSIFDKFLKNTQRKWPDWRKATSGKAIEHIRSEVGT